MNKKPTKVMTIKDVQQITNILNKKKRNKGTGLLDCPYCVGWKGSAYCTDYSKCCKKTHKKPLI